MRRSAAVYVVGAVLIGTLLGTAATCAGPDKSLTYDQLAQGWHSTDVPSIQYADVDAKTRCYRYINGFWCGAR
jgi:hypothetical protein